MGFNLLGLRVIISPFAVTSTFRHRRHKRRRYLQRTVVMLPHIYQLADGSLVMGQKTFDKLKKAAASDQAAAIESALWRGQ